LDSIKLQALGFDLASIRGSKKRQRYSWSGEVQSVVFVLEYDGAAFQQALKQEQAELDDMLAETQEPVDDRQQKELDNKKNDLKRMQLSNTRLYVIDAATDEQALFKKYADKNKYLFARGEVGLNWEDEALTGRIKELFINEIHVPLPDSRQVQTITQGKRLYSYGTEPVAPRYRVKLNIGQRFEPWIEAVYQ
ncbi:MAG: DUF4824 family protein, partial [Gammaproteobacteria bacterium]|nr:DUF4824 family protein [Gammaproteobacteria bacterium]